MSEKVKDDLFEDNDVVEEEEVVVPDDLTEGFVAEHDPNTRMTETVARHAGEADDMVGMSLDKQLTKIGRDTAEKLNKREKFKVIIPKNELSPNDTFVVVGINGWNLQIKRDVPVYLPDVVVDLLANGGYSPTLVR